MPLYLSLPPHWNFAKKDLDGKIKDILVHEETGAEIPMQDIIKDRLRAWPKKKICLEIKDSETLGIDFRLYKNRPYFETRYLKYHPNNNGKDACIEAPELITSCSSSVVAGGGVTFFGRWHQHAVLTEAKRTEAEAHDKAQRENRRHHGDKPLPT